MMCVVALTASALQSSNTPGDIFVTLTGSTGATREMLVTSGITQRQTVTTPVYHSAIGMIRSITLRLEGNNGVHLDEVKLVTHMGMEFLWLFSSPGLAHGGWLDGDSSNDDILPAQTLSVTDASARLPTDATPTVSLSVGTVTSMQAGASADGSRVEMVVFGSGGHVGPLRLATTDFISAAQKSTLQVPAAIGDFSAIKLCKSAMLSRFVALPVSQTLKCYCCR